MSINVQSSHHAQYVRETGAKRESVCWYVYAILLLVVLCEFATCKRRMAQGCLLLLQT